MKVKRQTDSIQNTHAPLEELNFKRKEFAIQMEKIIENLDDSFVISLDSEWGTGKTFFLKRFQEYLKMNNYCTLYYNAWENDDEKDPFLSLIVEFTDQIKEYIGKDTKIMKQILINASKIGIKTIPLLVEILLKKYIGDSSLEKFKDIVQISNEALTEFSENKLEEFAKEKNNKKAFKEGLNKFRNNLVSRKKMKNKVIVIIDELDRCRPDYTIELLERIKHLFNVENYIFILGIDRKQIVGSVKQVYGQEIDERNYLKRFFDFEFKLPSPNTTEYIELKIDSLLKEYSKEKIEILKLFGECSLACNMSLREVQKNWTALKLILDLIDDFENIYNALALPFLFTMRYYDREFYEKICKNKNFDKKNSESLSLFKETFTGVKLHILDMENVSFYNLLVSLFLKSEKIQIDKNAVERGIPVKFGGKIYETSIYRNRSGTYLSLKQHPLDWGYSKLELLDLFLSEDESKINENGV